MRYVHTEDDPVAKLQNWWLIGARRWLGRSTARNVSMSGGVASHGKLGQFSPGEFISANAENIGFSEKHLDNFTENAIFNKC